MNNQGEVRLIDFGFAIRKDNSSDLISSFCGTPTYMCPQLIKRIPYDAFKADVWALGILFYRMICGYYPFRGSTDQELNKLILKSEVHYSSIVVPEARELINGMLKKDEKTRFTVADVLQNEWFNKT